MTDTTTRTERNALIQRVDELAQRYAPPPQEEVPLLTEIVDPEAPRGPALPAAELEALAMSLEQAVMEQVAPEIDRIVETARAELRAEISASIHRAVREALAPLAKL